MSVTVVKFPIDCLNRCRPLQQALADLVTKHDALVFNHPARHELARMIRQLEGEIAFRGAQTAPAPG
ncbi:MAG TPA: hypothetical protein VME45_09690 [Stellaceae bacterium]|nr:hypothetical protein [Stellaceae bacterium]